MRDSLKAGAVVLIYVMLGILTFWNFKQQAQIEEPQQSINQQRIEINRLKALSKNTAEIVLWLYDATETKNAAGLLADGETFNTPDDN